MRIGIDLALALSLRLVENLRMYTMTVFVQKAISIATSITASYIGFETPDTKTSPGMYSCSFNLQCCGVVYICTEDKGASRHLAKP